MHMTSTSHTHELDFLLKSDRSGSLIGRVLQIPSIIVQGDSEKDIQEKIEKTTLSYLRHYDDEHTRVSKDTKSILTDSGHGTVVKTKQFIITC